MTDIFLSYSSTDRDKARALAEAIAQHGWTVWWDRQIPYGKSFDEVIEENLETTRCVLVLWTADSVSSKWVRAEASEGARRGLLVPVLLQGGLKIPLEFRLMQAADLSNWKPGLPDRDYDRLLAHIKGTLGSPVLAGVDDQPVGAEPEGTAATAQEDEAKEESSARHRGVPGVEHRIAESEWMFLLVWLLANAIGWGVFIFLNEFSPTPVAALAGTFLTTLVAWYPARRLAPFGSPSRSIRAYLLALALAVAISVALNWLEGDVLFRLVLGKSGTTGRNISDLIESGVPIYTIGLISGLTSILCGVQGALAAGVAYLMMRRYAFN